MDVADRYVLVSALRDAVVLVPKLDQFLVPRVAPSGENAGVAPRRPGSRAPVDESVLAVKERVEDVVFTWCGSVAEATGVPAPGGRSVEVRAAWLADLVDDVAECEWAELMLEDVVRAVRAVRDVVEPAPSSVVEVGGGGVLLNTGGRSSLGAVVGGGEWMPVADVVAGLGSLGFRVSESSVYGWVRSGRVGSVVSGSGVLVSPSEVARLVVKRRR